jgi:hypothetical protein
MAVGLSSDVWIADVYKQGNNPGGKDKIQAGVPSALWSQKAD